MDKADKPANSALGLLVGMKAKAKDVLRTVRVKQGFALCIGNHYHHLYHHLVEKFTIATETLAGWFPKSLGLRSTTLIDVPGGTSMLDLIEEVIDKIVDKTNDDGFILCFNRHGDERGVCGEDMEMTRYADIMKKVQCPKEGNSIVIDGKCVGL